MVGGTVNNSVSVHQDPAAYCFTITRHNIFAHLSKLYNFGAFTSPRETCQNCSRELSGEQELPTVVKMAQGHDSKDIPP